MARGWESKSVEAQMETAQDRSPAARIVLSAAEIALTRERENLQLSRTRVLRELETSRNPRYVDLLNQELRVLEERLCKLN